MRFQDLNLHMLHPSIGSACASGDTSKSQVRFNLDTSDINWEKLWHGTIKWPHQFAAPSAFVSNGRQIQEQPLKLMRKKRGARIWCPHLISVLKFGILRRRPRQFLSSESSETKQGNLKKSSTHEMSYQAPMHVGASGASCSVAHLEAKECTVNAPFAKMD